MKPNINDLANLPELKRVLTQLSVSPAAISTIEKSLKKGIVFEKPDDLKLLNIPVIDLTPILGAVEYGATGLAESNLKRIEYRFKPFKNEELFYGYQFIVTYSNNERFTVEQSYPIEDGGIVIVDLDPDDILNYSRISLQVKTAEGTYTSIRFGEADTEPTEKLLEVTTSDFANAIIQVIVPDLSPITAVAPVQSSYQIKGKVISNQGDTKLDGYQIVIYAATAKLPDGTPDFSPVAFATTETNGYFVTSYLVFTNPADITKVIAGQAMMAKEDIRKNQPIQPIKKTETLNSRGEDGRPRTVTKTMLPDRLILVIEEAGIQKEDCKDCGCNELNFYEKKVLEEYSYYTVVRTTEPSIIADVLEDEKEIDLEQIYGENLKDYGIESKVPISVFQKFYSIESRQIRSTNFLTIVPTIIPGAVTGNSVLSPGNGAGSLLRSGAIASTRPTELALESTNSSEMRKPGFSIELLKRLLVDYRAKKAIKGDEKPVLRGRTRLSPLNQIDWDDEPTIYQAASIAHGHLLHFKQEWMPDGYSLGDLVYSLPLAPGQKKQIAVLDWERRESAANSQALDYEEVLNSTLVRDRDINEVISATLTENIKGNSKASTGGIGFGFGSAVMGVFNGGSYGGLLGISGGKSSSGTSASQDAYRAATASSQQSLTDRTMQAASVVRSQRSTVVQTVSQGERVQATAESVANYNHCHALTIQYFEVLRHFTVRNRLAGVQECLFIPLQMTPFDLEKCLRWRNTLEKHLFRPELRAAFDAVTRIQNERESSDENYYDDIGYPRKYFAEQSISFYEGDLYLEFYFYKVQEKIDDLMIAVFNAFKIDLTPYKTADRVLTNDELAEIVGPRTIEYLLEKIVVEVNRNGVFEDLKLDLTLISPFRQGAPLYVSLRQGAQTNISIPRDQINAVQIRFDQSKIADSDVTNIDQLREKYMKVKIRSGGLRYRTKNFAGSLFRNSRVDNDLFVGNDTVYIPTPLTADELRNPRKEDVDAANNLIHHLNENMEYYHKCIFFDMTPERRFMLLDGIIAPGKGGGRSVASVVENKLIGIAGNSLIMPVAPGNQLDPTIDDVFDMFAQYYNEDPEPMRISMPTRGIYAEAIMGQCNSCEEKDESRFWRWEESPIPDSPNTQILPINTDTRRADPGDLQPKDFPAPIVNIQNAPNAPDPTGLQSILQLIGKGDSFPDLTGLNQNQLNALATYQKNLDTALAFGKEAAELAKTAGMMKMIQDAKNSGSLSNEDARSISKKTLDPDEARKETDQDLKQIEKAKQQEQVSEAPAEEMSIDRIRKGQGITKPSSGTLINKGKKKYDLTIYFRDFENRPIVGIFALNFGPLFNKIVTPVSLHMVAQINNIELDPSKENPLAFWGDPYEVVFPATVEEMIVLQPAYGEDFYFRGIVSPTLGENPNIVIFVDQQPREFPIEVSHELTENEVWEHAAKAEVGTELAGGAFKANGSYEFKKTTEEGTATGIKYTYMVTIPQRRLIITQKGVAP
jgi:hypothetical protein